MQEGVAGRQGQLHRRWRSGPQDLAVTCPIPRLPQPPLHLGGRESPASGASEGPEGGWPHGLPPAPSLDADFSVLG